MIDFGALPPEINSARMYAGPGPVSLSAAALAWDNLAADLQFTASSYRSVIAGLTTDQWMGPSSLAVASAFSPYLTWAAGTAEGAAQAAGQARFAAQIFEAAYAMTVHPAAVAANRLQLATLTATNFFGQNGLAIAATEAQYGEMWAQDASAMYGYAAGSAAASTLTGFSAPPEVANPAGLAGQAAAVAHSAAATGTAQLSLANLVSAVPTALQSLASPASSTSLASLTSLLSSTLSGSSSGLLGTGQSLFTTYAAIPGWFGMFIGSNAISPTMWTPISNALTHVAAVAPVAAAENAVGAATEAAVQTVSAVSSGPGVLGSVGAATSLGPLSVPASWTSVIPTAKLSAVSALPDAAIGPNASPSLMGALPPRSAGSGRSLGPRYGIVPTVMTRPPAAGYA